MGVSFMHKCIKAMRWQTVAKMATVGLMLCAVLWSCTAQTVESYRLQNSQALLQSSFTQVVAGQEIALENLADFQAVATGEPLVLVCQIPTIHEDKTLLFYSKDVEVQVYLDDICVYDFSMQPAFAMLQTPGNAWNQIPICAEMSGSTLTLVLTSNFDNRYQTTLAGLYLIDASQTLDVVLNQEGLRVLESIVLLVVAVLVYLNAAIWKRAQTKAFLFRLANLYLGAALWLISMYNGFDYFAHNPMFSYMLSMLLANFLPVLYYELIKVVMQKPNALLNTLGMTTWVHMIAQLVLQFVFGVSLLNLLPLTIAVYGLGAAAVIALLVHHVVTQKEARNLALVSMFLVLAGALGEAVVLCIAPARTDLIGVSSVAGLLLYLAVNHFNIILYESKIDMEKLELEQNYNKLQNTTLMQQIKAHFFFNTLNTISAMCKYDAQAADRAIHVFAKYMRSYMRLISEQENIPFARELDIIEATLEIERMRFPERFTYEIDCSVTDFKLPPLSLQPIVENSMIHGLRGMSGKMGTIRVQTRKVGNCVQIIITDNGVGFDIQALENSQSIGLRNLEKRVHLMANGTVQTQSEKGKGTQTAIMLPMC